MNLKNLTFTSWLGQSWNAYWSNALKVWKLYIFLFIPLVFFSFIAELTNIIQSGAGTLIMVLAVIFAIIFSLLVTIAVYLQFNNILQGKEGKDSDVQSLLTDATPLFWPYILTYLVNRILLTIGFILLIVPGIILTVFWVFTEAAVILRGKQYMSALDYSYALVQGRWWRVAGYMLSISIISLILAIVPDEVLSQFGIPGRLIALIITAIFAPWFVMAELMLFLHLEQTRAPGASEVPRLLRPMKKVSKKRSSSPQKRKRR